MPWRDVKPMDEKILFIADHLRERGCPEFCVNGISLLLRHPVFKLDSKPV